MTARFTALLIILGREDMVVDFVYSRKSGFTLLVKYLNECIKGKGKGRAKHFHIHKTAKAKVAVKNIRLRDFIF